MQFRILGPLEVEEDKRALTVGGGRQRSVLALLLLHANRVVSRDILVDAIWGEQPPETAATALHGAISALRKTLGTERIQTRAPGYLLVAEPESVDCTRFEALVERGRSALAAGQPARASTDLASGLALWRGTPFADLDAAPFVAGERLRLDEARIAALEDRVEADLALGWHAALVSELHALVHEHPLRERVRGQLMVALYRAGRQAEALEVYRQGRHLLAEELGLEPGEALRRLERAILDHDPALAAPPTADREKPEVAARPSTDRHVPRPPTRPLAIAAAGLLAAAVAVAAAVAFTGGESSRVTVVPNSLAVVDPRTNRLVDDVAVGKNPVAVALGNGSVFVANADDRTVSRIDPQSRRVTDVIGVGTEVRDLAPGFGSLWVAGGNDGTIARVDLASNSVRTFRFGAGSGEPVFWISTGAGAVWATRGSTLLRIDPETNSVVRTRIPAPAGLAAGRGAIWIPTADGRLLRVSPHPNSVSAQALHLVGGPASAPAVGMGALWLAAYAGHGEIQRIDPQAVGISSTNAEAVAALSGTARTPGTPLDVAVGEGAVWAVDGRGVVVRIQPKTMRVAATIATAPTLRSALAAGYGAVWIAVQQPR